MKKTSYSFYFSLCLLLSQYNPASAQNRDTADFPYWIAMMQDRSIPFHSTQSAFYQYWSGRQTDVKGNGYKVFKRWEYINKERVMPDGKLLPDDYVYRVYDQFIRNVAEPRSLSGTWTLAGPSALPANNPGQPNGMGRINTIAFHPSNADTYFVGAASGGIWKTTNDGNSWASLTSNMPTLGVSSILVHPSNPDILYLGSGDRDSGDAFGLGVFKSTNGGASWVQITSGMDANTTIAELAMHPSDPNIILAATSTGLYRTTNGGASWSKRLTGTLWKDVKFKPGDPTISYATYSGSLYTSANTGNTWSLITLPVTGAIRIAIAVTPDNPDYVYLVLTKSDKTFSALLRSVNSGVDFTVMSTSPNIFDYLCDGSETSGQGFYDLCIAADPTNANTIYVGSINNWKSTDGGFNWTIVSHWVGSTFGTICAASVHADQHAYGWSPVTTGKLYVGNDGGVYKTSNGGSTWTEVSSGLEIAQVYKIGQSATNSALTMNGYQDNGSSIRNGASFTTERGGDGMECIIDYSNTNYRYLTNPSGDIRRTTTGTGGTYSKIAGNNSNGITESGAWVTPYLLHKFSPDTMFVGYKNVWRSSNIKTSLSSNVAWTPITAGESANCIAMDQSPANRDILYVVRSGQIKRTDNANASGSVVWTTCTLPGSSYTPTDIKAHPTNPNIVYVSAHFGVYKSTNKGLTWVDISGSLPPLFTNCIVYDNNSNEGLYVGNQTGIWYKDATLSDWVNFSSGLPIVDIRELEIYADADPVNSRLVAATYGRGIWSSDLYVTVLPVELTSFQPICHAGNIELKWTTATEQDNDFFTIERSKDGLTWQQIAKVKGAGNSAQPISYSVKDDAPIPDVLYYRLKQTDFNGHYKNSNWVSIKCNLAGKSPLSVFPNPATRYISVENFGDVANVKIYNAMGGLVYQSEIAGNQADIDIFNFMPGFYFLEVSSEVSIEIIPFVKE